MSSHVCRASILLRKRLSTITPARNAQKTKLVTRWIVSKKKKNTLKYNSAAQMKFPSQILKYENIYLCLFERKKKKMIEIGWKKKTFFFFSNCLYIADKNVVCMCTSLYPSIVNFSPLLPSHALNSLRLPHGRRITTPYM